MDSNYVLGPNGELYHWGIKGMKWGIRRYQNKDGSLTPAGRKRYAEEEAKLKAREKTIKGKEKEAARRAKLDAKKAELDAREAALKKGKAAKSETQDTQAKFKPKTFRDMTDDELREYTTRMQLEKQYIEAQKNLSAAMPQKVSKGKQFMNSFMKDVVGPAATNAGKAFLEKKLKEKLGVAEKLEDKVKRAEQQYKKLEWETKIKDLEKAGTLKEQKKDSWDDKTKQQTYEQNRQKTQVAKEKYNQYVIERQRHIDAGDYEDWIKNYKNN